MTSFLYRNVEDDDIMTSFDSYLIVGRMLDNL